MAPKRYDFVKVIILSIVTCGIYTLIMWSDMANGINAAEKTEPELKNFWLMIFILAPITCGIYSYIWMYKYMKKLTLAASAKGVSLSPSNDPMILFLCLFVPIYSYYVLVDTYNKAIVD